MLLSGRQKELPLGVEVVEEEELGFSTPSLEECCHPCGERPGGNSTCGGFVMLT